MNCIVCGRETQFSAVRSGVEAALCHYHYPIQRAETLVIRVVCR